MVFYWMWTQVSRATCLTTDIDTIDCNYLQ